MAKPCSHSGAGLSNLTAVSTAQAWTESLVLVRLLRDIGAGEPAREVLERARQVVAASGFQEANQGVLNTLSLQIEVMAASSGEEPTGLALKDLLSRAAEACREALDHPPELGPITSLFGQVMRMAREAGAPCRGRPHPAARRGARSASRAAGQRSSDPSCQRAARGRPGGASRPHGSGTLCNGYRIRRRQPCPALTSLPRRCVQGPGRKTGGLCDRAAS